MSSTDLPYWLALNENPKFGPQAFKKLSDHFPSMKEAFFASKDELREAGIAESQTEYFINLREQIHPERLLEEATRNNFKAITIHDDSYPTLLKEIYDPPGLLYVAGYLPTSEVTHLAVVGSRKATNYGLQNAHALSSELAAAGVVIVSGLAYGIDEAAHMAALEADGLTVAVLACGLLKLDSRQRYVAKKIIDAGGAVISEFPLHSPSLNHYFPYRNRIISGMSHGTLVVEAAEQSGSLITARAALEQNRDVFAVPGLIHTPTAKGTNNLIKMGAHVVTEAKDILDLLQIDTRPAQKKGYKPASQDEEIILQLLSKTPIHINELIRKTDLNSASIASNLAILEVKGHVQQIGGMYYILL
ncbi:DNA-processing protein DprA [Patescibacteria group bacterium]|nr:DNA-processing protein DprA [Patescibacteria group bacterium]